MFADQKDADHWEPKAASVEDRIRAIQEAHNRGIKTWVSMEPVIDPGQALQIICDLHPIVGHWKVGKINYHKTNLIDWITFREEVQELLDCLGADYYLKKSLTDL